MKSQYKIWEETRERGGAEYVFFFLACLGSEGSEGRWLRLLAIRIIPVECKQKQFRLLRCFGSIDVGLVIYFLASGRANGYSRYSSMNMEHKILGIDMDRGKETWTRNTYLYGFVVGDSVYLMPGSL